MSLPAFASLVLSAKGAAAASAVAVATAGGLGAVDQLPPPAQAAFDAVTGSRETEETLEAPDGEEAGSSRAETLERVRAEAPEAAHPGLDRALEEPGRNRARSDKANAEDAGGEADDAGSAEDAPLNRGEAPEDAGQNAQRRADAAQKREEARAKAQERQNQSRDGKAEESSDAGDDAAGSRDDAAGNVGAPQGGGRANAPTTDDTVTDDAAVTPDLDGPATGDVSTGDAASTKGRGRPAVRD